MTFPQTLDYLYQHLPMFQRIGAAAYKKDLTNTLALCAHLGNPHEKFPTIHVGGTNGKGSVSHILAALCQAAGLKTGLYVSPHYKDFTERIKIDGQYMPKRRVTAFVAQHKALIETIQPSFFELCVAMAFDHFAREKVDIAIIEVGLGGRLDSTNVITPLLSVITNISYDHTNLLGDTLPQIAYEKAGIIKPGIPVVIGEKHPESAPVFLKKAAETGSDLVFADQEITLKISDEAALSHPVTNAHTTFHLDHHGQRWLSDVEINLSGPYQAKNITTALKAWMLLQQMPPIQGKSNETTLRKGLKNLAALTRFMGRWQMIGQNPTILCDSAHNEAGLREAFGRINAWLGQTRPSGATLHLVTGMVNDKDLSKALALFPQKAQYYFAKANIPRGLDAEQLRQEAARYGLQGRAYTSVRQALAAARRAAAPDDLILVIGSIFVVGEVLPRVRG
jgi:dihydrofolate synthase/folylpolyglutamate synthase